jgi:hypothetical protein
VRSLTVEIALAGRAGGTKVRGRIQAGFAEPASVRLEGLAPFGPPVFVLAATQKEATLLLPRGDRVVRTSRAEDLLEALAGVAFSAAELRAVLSGCVSPDPRAAGGTAYGTRWLGVDLGEGVTAFLRIDSAPRVAAARVKEFEVEYADFQNGIAQRIRLRSTRSEADGPTDLTLTLHELELNVSIEPAAFVVNVPADALPMTVDELRAAGPLGTGRRSGR